MQKRRQMQTFLCLTAFNYFSTFSKPQPVYRGQNQADSPSMDITLYELGKGAHKDLT